MKAIFEFNLPEDQREYDVMNQSITTQSFLWEFNQELRNWQKYGHQFKSADDALDKIREQFYKMINDYQINIDL